MCEYVTVCMGLHAVPEGRWDLNAQSLTPHKTEGSKGQGGGSQVTLRTRALALSWLHFSEVSAHYLELCSFGAGSRWLEGTLGRTPQNKFNQEHQI